MSFKTVMAGLEILRKYIVDEDSFPFYAEHDKISVAVDISVSTEDFFELDYLGFHLDEDDDTWYCYV